jgi:hypothetical protein
MRAGSHFAQQHRLLPAIEFIKTSISKNMPANIFILIDTHADAASGCLQHTGGKSMSANTKIVSLYLFTTCFS